MKKIFWMTAAGLALMLAACGSPPSAAVVPTPGGATPAPVVFSSPDAVVASAEAQPAQAARLSFAISAPLKEIFVQEGDAVKAGQILMTLYAPEFEGAVTQAELREKSAALEFTYWIPHRFDRPPERKWQAEAEWNQTKTALDVAKANLGQISIYAPFDAVAVEINAQPGEFAQAGRAVITLADLAHMQIVATDLSERDAPLVKIGQTANVYIEALDVNLTGRVIRISPLSKTIGGDVVYPVTIELDKQPQGLLWGMSAEVKIQTR